MLLAAALTLHALAVWSGGSLSLLVAANLMLLVMSIFVTVALMFLPVASLVVLVAAISAVALLMLGVSDAPVPLDQSIQPLLLIHITASISAVSVLMLAFFQSLLLLRVEADLKSHTLNWARLLPPLETLERLLFAAVWVGLVLLVIAIGTGFIYLDDLFAQRGMVHHTVLLSAAALVYVTLLVGRYRFGWRGATAVRWIIGATVLLLLGYFGSKFVMEVVLATP